MRSRAVIALSMVCALSPFGSVLAEDQKVVIKGSNTFGEELAPALIEKYRSSHPNAVIELEAKGSASGIAALLANECDIASSSRAMNEDEKRLAKSRNIKAKDYLVGLYGVTVVVNSENAIKGLSDKQVRDIFIGAITNWKDVGGKDAPITPYIRDSASGTYLGFQELAMEKKPYATSAKMLSSYADIAAAVRSDGNGIGYGGMDARTKGIRAVPINRVIPDIFALAEGRYPYARSLWLYTNENSESAVAKDFIKFVIGKQGQEIVSNLGFARRYERSFSSYNY